MTLSDRPFATIQPPPVESLGVAYFKPLMLPTPVGTRLPQPDKEADTVNGFLRIETAGGTPTSSDLLFDMNLILHAYSPDEIVAEDIVSRAVAWGGNIQGTTTMVGGYGWYVTYSRVSAMPSKQVDPMVKLTRYRAMVSWRLPGRAL